MGHRESFMLADDISALLGSQSSLDGGAQPRTPAVLSPSSHQATPILVMLPCFLISCLPSHATKLGLKLTEAYQGCMQGLFAPMKGYNATP